MLDRAGRQKQDEAGNPLWEHARLDLRLEGGPEEPTTYGDVVVTQTRAESWVRAGAAQDGRAAADAAARKRRRYPPEKVPGATLVAFSVEAGGRWHEGTLRFLKRAAGRAAERHPGLAALDGQGAAVVYSSWLGQLSCALQKANVACLRSAGAGVEFAPGAPVAGGAGEEPERADGEEDDWLAEQVDELLYQAAAVAGADLP